MKQKFVYFLQLGRVGMSPLTMSAPIMGALAVGKNLSLGEVLGWGGLGLCAHLFGFTLNDIIDHPLDRTLATHQGQPLVTGTITVREAQIFALLQIPLAFCIYVFLLQGHSIGIVVLCTSVTLGAFYNFWSKRGVVPRFLSELSLATSIGLLCLLGSTTTLSNYSVRGVIFSLTVAIGLLLLNSVSSGLKDLKTDAAFGARSFVLCTGSKMLDADEMHISRTLQIYSTVIQILFYVLLLLSVSFFDLPGFTILLISFLSLYGGLHLRMLLTLRSFTALRNSMPLLNGYYNYAALSLLVLRWMPFWMQGFYIFFILSLLLFPLRLGFRMWRTRYLLVR